MPAAKILVVEDEPDILELIRLHLVKEGYQVACAQDGYQAMERIRADRPDLIILDLMLPDTDGLDICRQIRADPNLRSIQVLIVTARAEDVDIVTGLEVGADDYLTKPFSPRILVARAKNLLRRRAMQIISSQTISIGKLTIDPQRREVTVAGRPLELSYTQFNILYALAQRAGTVMNRYQIMDAASGPDHIATDRAIDVQICSLRQKLGVCGKYIQTIRGVGYKLTDK